MNGGTAAISNNCVFNGNSAKSGNGGAIRMGNSTSLTIEDTKFISNTAKYGGAISNEIGTLIVEGCTFDQNSVSAQGGAICSYDAALADPYAVINEGKKASLYVYDSVFSSNKSSNQGAAIKVQGSGYLVIVNSTYTNNVCSNAGGVVRIRCGVGTKPEDGVTAWMINVSSNNPTASSKRQYALFNQTSTAYVYNSIFSDYGKGGTPDTKFYTTIKGTEFWQEDGVTAADAVVFADQIGAFADGVFPAKGEAAEKGMTSTALAALADDIKAVMPLFDATKLTVDQKGHSREGKTIMGAYVGE